MRKYLFEVERIIAGMDNFVELRQAMQHQTLKFRHVLQSNRLAFIVGQRSQHPAQGIAQLAVSVDCRFQDFRSDTQVFGIVSRHDPKAQNISAGLLDDILGSDIISQ